ncbi:MULTISPECIES: ABC transporter permease [Shewanella]|uniref:ABC transporter permease subunit n=1 Tax=Shewanella psychromarinicola TaxID=2487742 RepID=A0A3N4E4F7_9GAMM|nr:ABC transporter permease subunit [Shewanella psychromarinicola]AZG35244.1 ABC transporter permease subunit [Shewanella psychromarinicola]MCL1082597.1 ABC transporter permease subunit [Shewanella psychromarinicola]RPA32953.1 ABC transporter permease subunit [Shewanella psychromarinicola]
MMTSTSGFTTLVRSSPYLMMALLVIPVLSGLIAVILPAFGWFPVLGHTQFSVAGFVDLWQTPGLGYMALLSVSTSFISTLLAFVITILILGSYFTSPWLGYIQRLLGPILVIPHAAAAIAIGFLITPSGMLSRIVSPWLSGWDAPPDWLYPHDAMGLSIIIGLTLKELPFLLLMALGVLAQPELGHTLRAQHRVALSLGYCPMTAFFKVVLPSLYPFLRLPILAVLAYASASVEIPLILGPNSPPTLAVAIMQWFHDVDLSLRIKASAGAILQIVLTLLLLLSWWLLEKLIKKASQTMLINGQREYAGAIMQNITHVLTVVIISAIGLALIGMMLWSVAGFWHFPTVLPQQFVSLHWQSALQQMHTPLLDTVLIGVCATSLAIILTLFTLEAEQYTGKMVSRLSSVIIYLPLLIPSIAFLFGLVWLLEQINSHHSFINVVLAHLLFVLPYVFLSLSSSYRRLDPRFSTVAASLGASEAKIFWQIKLPMLLAPILIACALGLAISFSQYLPTLLAGGGRINTITTEAVSLANGGSRRTSAVYALVQMALPALGFLLAWLLPKMLFRHRE